MIFVDATGVDGVDGADRVDRVDGVGITEHKKSFVTCPSKKPPEKVGKVKFQLEKQIIMQNSGCQRFNRNDGIKQCRRGKKRRPGNTGLCLSIILYDAITVRSVQEVFRVYLAADRYQAAKHVTISCRLIPLTFFLITNGQTPLPFFLFIASSSQRFCGRACSLSIHSWMCFHVMIQHALCFKPKAPRKNRLQMDL